jgi:hypothetical protein
VKEGGRYVVETPELGRQPLWQAGRCLACDYSVLMGLVSQHSTYAGNGQHTVSSWCTAQVVGSPLTPSPHLKVLGQLVTADVLDRTQLVCLNRA